METLTQLATSRVIGIFALVSFVLLIASWLDRIATPAFKAENASRLRGHSRHLEKYSMREHIKIFIDNTIGNYFVGVNFSVANIWKCMKLTLVSLSIVILIVCVVNQVSPAELFSFEKNSPLTSLLPGAIFFLFACFAIDVMSFLQTAMFMRLASASAKPADMLALAVFDIVVTLNIFTFAYSAILSVTVLILDRTINVLVTESIINTDLAWLVEGQPQEPGSEKAAYELARSSVYLENTPGRSPIVYHNYVKYKGYTESDLAWGILVALGAEVNKISRVSDSQESKSANFSAEIKMPRLLSGVSPGRLYSSVYESSHDAQNYFLGLLRFELIKTSVSNVAARVIYSDPYFSSNYLLELCDGKSLSSKDQDVKMCQKYVYADLSNIKLGIYRAEMARGFGRSIVYPVSIMILSSLLLTIAFYIGLLIYLFLVVVGRIGNILLLSGQYIDLDNWPLLTAACLGFAYASLLIAGAFVLALALS